MNTIIVLLSLIATINGLTYDTDGKRWIDFDTKYTPKNTLIIGGSPAPVGFAPYQVSLRRATGNHMCGGSILNTRWILTAAHCIREDYPIIYAVVGTNKLNSGGTNYTIKVKVPHADFNRTSLKNDIGLMKTSRDIAFSALVKPINLPSKDLIPGNTVPIIITGWGRTIGSSPTLPNDLQFTKMIPFIEEFCKYYLKNVGLDIFIFPTSLCTITIGTSTCNGDSGGPLVYNGVQYGIVSWGTTYEVRCDTHFPAVSNRVFQYILWIASTQYAHRSA